MSAEIIKKRIIEKQGQVIDPKEINSEVDSLDILIVPENCEKSTILKLMNLETLPNCKVLIPSWAIDSIKSKKIKGYSKYEWIDNSLVLPQKRYQDPSFAEICEANPKKTLKNAYVKNKDLSEINRLPQNSKFVDENLTLRQELLRNRDKFTFSKGKNNLNTHITSELEKLMNNYSLLKDKGRELAYRFAIISLQSYPEKITSPEQVKNLYKIGSKMKQKIEEIIKTGTLSKLQSMDNLVRLKSIKEFSKIWGVGVQTSEKLFNLGYRSIDCLKKNPPEILNENQRVGLEFYEDLKQKIPRNEVKLISEIVISHAKKIYPDLEIEANTCGSYRRGRELCGDIDILITFGDFGSNSNFLSDLVHSLQIEGTVTHVLTLSKTVKKHEHLTFEGIARLENGLHRRLDIKVYPRKYYAWALLYFTGSANFNRSFRLFAKTKGLKLTDEGLFPAIRKNGETFCGKNILACYTEAEIFQLFGMPYKPPTERDL